MAFSGSWTVRKGSRRERIGSENGIRYKDWTVVAEAAAGTDPPTLGTDRESVLASGTTDLESDFSAFASNPVVAAASEVYEDEIGKAVCTIIFRAYYKE